MTHREAMAVAGVCADAAQEAGWTYDPAVDELREPAPGARYAWILLGRDGPVVEVYGRGREGPDEVHAAASLCSPDAWRAL